MVEQVSLYRAPTTAADAEAIAAWLDDRIDATVSVRDRFCSLYADDGLAEEYAETRVLSSHERETGNEMFGIVRYEQRGLDHAHIVLTSRVLGTWGDHDGRWHKRVNVLGQPALVSVPGVSEAPAKPEAYYKEKQKHAMVSGDTPPREVLEQHVEGDFLVEDDPRTTEALKGFVLQAAHYLATGEAFCDEEGCRLHNPHRQPGVIEAQLREPEFCERHASRYRNE